MSKSVATAIEGRSQTLFEKIISNNDVANMIMALVSQLVIMSNQKGTPIEGIRISEPIWSDNNTLSARIEFSAINLTQSLGIWNTQDDMRNYVASKSAHLAKVFDRNPNVLTAFRNIVNSFDKFCDQKRIKFSSLKFEKSIISRENILAIIISKEHFNKWGQ